MNWGNRIWWFMYICLGIFLQAGFSGLDFLLPGLIVAIQERKPVQLIWVLLIFTVLQEGMGSMAFGSTLIWYVSTSALFYLGYSLFEVENFLFIFLLSGCLAATHIGIMHGMAILQNLPLNFNRLIEESVFQALVTPFVWRIAQTSRRLVNHAH